MIDVPECVAGRKVTADSMFDGAVTSLQFCDGYRFSIDAILAAHFHTPSKEARILDLGAGCGIIGLIMMYRWGQRISSVQAFELQTQLKELTEQNFKLNNYDHICSCVQGDVKSILHSIKPESCTQVVCNPPFYNALNGRQSLDEQSRVARHQVSANLVDFTKAAAVAVKNGGTVVFIYPAEKFTELTDALERVRLEMKVIQFVYSYPGKENEARLVLVRCVKNGGKGVRVAAPFYIYEHKNGNYSPDMLRLYSPEPLTEPIV
jgi:tRNA1Val (adenine37-N6)-methyltransferase